MNATRLVRHIAVAVVTFAVAGHADDARALVMQFSATADTQTYFAGQPYEIKAGFTGSGGSGCCVSWEGLQYAPRVPTTVTLIEDALLNAHVNTLIAKHPTADWPLAGQSASETHTIGYTFTLLSPNVVGTNTVTIDMDLTVSFSSIANPPILILYDFGPGNQSVTHTFDLGADGMLDVTFLPRNASSGITRSHIGSGNAWHISANFLLRDVPDAVPEPGTMLLAGGGVLGFAALGRRRKRR